MDSNDKHANDKANLKRRHFLVAAAAGSAGTTALIVGGTSAVPPVLKSADDKAPGYTASEHVRNYYRTTRI